jgi:signal transduction histidine kinase
MTQRKIEKERQLSGEWIVYLVRWGVLAGVVLMALLDPVDHLSLSELALFLAVVGIYNLAITVLLYLRVYFRALPALTLVADVLAQISLLYLSGGASSPYVFFALFPILVATLRFGWQAGLLTAGIFFLNDVFQTAVAWEIEQAEALIFQLGWHTLLFVLAVSVSAVISERVPVAAVSERRLAAYRQQIVPEHLKMVYELASSLSATLNYERVLEAILDISRLGFDELGMRIGESVGIVLLYAQDGWLTIASHRNLVTREDEWRRVKGTKGIVAEAITSGKALIGGASAEDPELRVFDSLQPCRSMICVPLRAGFETYGAVLFATVKRDAYASEHVELLTLFCSQATIALQNATLYKSLREERDKIVDKEEQARHKLARELHDGPTQDVAAIAMRLNFARLLVERDTGRAKAELERLEDLAHRTVKEIRSMLFALRPVILETEGLLAALNQYAENLQENDDLPVEVDPEGYQDCLDIEAQGVVFAILEEAINNARKHAQASHVWVRLRVKDDLFVAEVIDNGRGFDVDAVESEYSSRGSLGMVNLKERADLIGGTINIRSSPGEGTHVTLLVPIGGASG